MSQEVLTAPGAFTPAAALARFEATKYGDEHRVLQGKLLHFLEEVVPGDATTGHVARSINGEEGEICVAVHGLGMGKSVVVHLLDRSQSSSHQQISATLYEPAERRITRVRFNTNDSETNVTTQLLASAATPQLYAIREQTLERGTYNPDLQPGSDLPAAEALDAYATIDYILADNNGVVDTQLTAAYAANAPGRVGIIDESEWWKPAQAV